MAAVKRLLSAPWKLLAIVRSFRRLARNFRRLARNLHAVAGAVLLRLFHHVVAQLLEWFSPSCSYIVVICPFLPSPLAPPTPSLGVGGVRGAGCFCVSLLLRARIESRQPLAPSWLRVVFVDTWGQNRPDSPPPTGGVRGGPPCHKGACPSCGKKKARSLRGGLICHSS